VLIELFKRTSNRHSKANKLIKSIEKIRENESTGIGMIEAKKISKSKRKHWIFPWWFKIILHCISFICILTAIILILVKGIRKNIINKFSFLSNNLIVFKKELNLETKKLKIG